MRTIIVSEYLGPPLDEGILKFATSLIGAFDSYGDAIGVATGGESLVTEDVLSMRAGKLFRNGALRKELRACEPDLVVYVPSASGTLFSYLRARALKRACPTAHVSMVLTQVRKHTAFTQMVLPRLVPDSIFCQSQKNMRYLSAIGIESAFLPSGVDCDLFHPVSLTEKERLRTKYNLPPYHYLVLHAGHLTAARNTQVLAKLERVGRGVVLAGSAGHDPALKQWLEQQGVIVIDKYIDNVQELYQAVDCYVFPTQKSDAAIDFPLSVLEAMATDLPVVAYPYGGLPLALEPRDGLVFAENEDDMLRAVHESRNVRANTRAQVLPLDWPNIAGIIVEAVEVRNAGAIVAGV